MVRTALDLTPEEMAPYRQTMVRRYAEKQRESALRRERAWEVTRAAARLLKEQFGAARVMVFGSLTRTGLFDQHSDVDLAVGGLDERLYLRALSCLLDLDPEIPVDLAEIETARPALRAAIEREGVLL